MKAQIALLLIATFLLGGCTPSMHLRVKYLDMEEIESKLRIQFDFVKERKNEIQHLDLRRVWIYENDCLVFEMEKFENIENIQSSWDFPSIPKGFKVTFPKNLDTIPTFKNDDRLRFEFLAGGSYSQWEHRPNS